MRLLTAFAAALGLAPVLVALPTIPPPAPSPHPVAPVTSSFAPSGTELIKVAEPGSTAFLGPRPPVAYTSERRTSRFDLVGVTWRADGGTAAEAPQVSVRVREQGRWSGWQVLEISEDAPDPDTAEGRAAASVAGTEPLVTDHADGVQVRVDTPDGRLPDGLRVDLVDPGRSAADAALQSPSPPASASAATTQPTIITRRQWGADETLRSGTTTINPTVRALFLHHTDGSNTYPESQSAAQVRAVYAYHTKFRHWNDIGYNFLVDRYGQIFEGRAGSITQAVMGAHTGGFNTDTMGVSAIGNFDVARPPAAVVSAVERVMAWKAAQFEINPLGMVTLTSAGGGTSRYPAGVQVRIHTISGHRDVGRTACPGRYLYPDLGAIRATLARWMHPALVRPTVHPAVTGYGGGPMEFSAAIPTTQRWTMTVTPMCAGHPIRTLTGRSASRLTASWPLTDDDDAPVPPGVYTLRVSTSSPVGRAPTWAADVEVLPTASAPTSGCPTERLLTGDPVAASVEVGQRVAPTGSEIVIAAATQPVDGLLAAPFARDRDAPLLLTAGSSLPVAIRDEVTRRAPSRVWIVGAAGAVPDSVVTELHTLGVVTVTRLAGSTRYATAAAVATAIGPSTRAFLVSGADAAASDLVAASGMAGALGWPVLLSTPTALPAVTGNALRAIGVTRVDVVGGPAAVSSAVTRRLPAYGVTGAVRRSGADRYGTAAALALAYRGLAGAGGAVVAPSPSTRLVDDVLGAAFGRITLLSGARAVPPATAGYLVAARPAGIVLPGRQIWSATMHRIYRDSRGLP